MKTIFLRGLLVLISVGVFLSMTGTADAQMFRIEVTNGDVFTTNHYYEQDGIVYIQRYGQYIGFAKDEIVKITRDETTEMVEEPYSAEAEESDEYESLLNKRSLTKEERNKLKALAEEKNRANKAQTEKEKKIKRAEARLRSTRNSQRIACAQAGAPPPKVTSSTSGEKAGAYIRGQYKAAQSCQYYNDLIPELEQQLEKLKNE